MKPRRDITLGEMQDECQFRDCDCTTHGGGTCDYFDVCESMHNKKDNFQSPYDWDLTDPPRFNEQQMALLKALYASGVVKIAFGTTNDLLRCLDAERDMAAGLFWEKIGLPREELDLAELIGKESNEK
jgi:hypothetical protein